MPFTPSPELKAIPKTRLVHLSNVIQLGDIRSIERDELLAIEKSFGRRTITSLPKDLVAQQLRLNVTCL